jgi:hypothetical protein
MKYKSILIEKYIEPSEVFSGMVEGTNIRFFLERWIDKYGDYHSSMCHPAIIRHEEGKLYSQLWLKKGKHHRERGLPAIILYHNEKEIRQDWYTNDNLIKMEKN